MKKVLRAWAVLHLIAAVSIMGFAQEGGGAPAGQESHPAQYQMNPRILKITSPKTDLVIGESLQLTYRGLGDGQPRWETRDNGVISLDGDGVVRGLAKGNASIRLYIGNYVDMFAICVTDEANENKYNKPFLNYIWKTVGGNKYCFNADTNMPLVGFQLLDNRWYFFDKRGVMQRRWMRINEKDYYFSDGIMLTGARKIGTRKYEFSAYGQLIDGDPPEIKNIATVPADTVPTGAVPTDAG